MGQVVVELDESESKGGVFTSKLRSSMFHESIQYVVPSVKKDVIIKYLAATVRLQKNLVNSSVYMIRVTWPRMALVSKGAGST